MTTATPEVKALVAPVAGTPEHDAILVKKFDDVQAAAAAKAAGSPTTPAASPPEPTKRPEHVPEKFWDAQKGVVNYEAWSKSTAEAEKRLTELSQQQAAAVKKSVEAKDAIQAKVRGAADALTAAEAAVKAATDEKSKADATVALRAATDAKAATDAEAKALAGDAPTAEKVLESGGLDLKEFSDEFAKNEKLSDESYKKLAKVGIDKATVDQYIAGQYALGEQVRQDTFAVTGGEENYSKMTTWASANLTRAEIEAFNSAVSGSKEQRELSVAGMYQKYVAANGINPALLSGGNNQVTGGGYQSRSQMTADMRDPRYATDPTFRAEVERKVGATTAF